MTINYLTLIDMITKALAESDGEALALFANEILDKKVTYIEDSQFVIEEYKKRSK